MSNPIRSRPARRRWSSGPGRVSQAAWTAALAVALLVLVAASPGFAQDDEVTDFSNFVYSSSKTFSSVWGPVGLWSDGTIIWVRHVSDGKLAAYTLATRARADGYDIDLADGTNMSGSDGDGSGTSSEDGNANPRGIWSDGTTMWVADQIDGDVYAYTLDADGDDDIDADDTSHDDWGARDSSKDIQLSRHSYGNSWKRKWTDMWSNGTTLWVANNWGIDSKLFAFTLSSGARDSSKDIRLRNCSCQPWGLWSNETTLWVADAGDDKLYAYTLSTGARDSSKDFELHADNDDPSGIWLDGTTLWVADVWVDKIFIYEQGAGGDSVGGL